MSRSAYENAALFAKLGFNVFPTGRIWQHESRSIATSDLEALEAIHRIDPACNWRVRCSRDDRLICLGTRRKCDFDAVVQAIGALPRTLMIARPSGTMHRLFAIDADDPDLRQSVPLFGVRAWLKNSVPVPGSLDRSGEHYEWMNGTPDETPLAHLTEEQLYLLPKTGSGVTATVTRYPEFSPSPHY